VLYRTRNSFDSTVRNCIFSCLSERNVFPFSSSAHQPDSEKVAPRFDMLTIFDEILSTCPTTIRDEALQPFHQIERYLILADYNRLFQSILTFVQQPDINGCLLRFATHICLFLFEQNSSEHFHENQFAEILTVYIQHLIELEFKDLVCYYISKLPEDKQCKTKSIRFVSFSLIE